MENRYKNLQELKQTWNIKVEGINNYPCDGNPSIIVANHSCLMDIFYLPAILPENTISLISARLLFKKIKERQEMVNKKLYALPIEAHGGGVYANMCLNTAFHMLENGYSLNLFPEGAYLEDHSVIYRGRTGGARILFQAKAKNINVHLVPVAIDVQNENLDLDSYHSNGNQIKVIILEEIDYQKQYNDFLVSNNELECNLLLHQVTDNALSKVAAVLNREYRKEYIPLFPKGNVIFRNGQVVPTMLANEKRYVEEYQQELEQYRNQLYRKLQKRIS